MIDIKRTFIPGDTWLYYKIYCGAKTSDELLIKVFPVFIEDLLKTNTIKKWFFIRYSDPDTHIRIRFEVINSNDMSNLMVTFNKLLNPFIESKLVWKIQMDTYNRELERYGASSIEVAEEIFFLDSQMITSILRYEDESENENLKWLSMILAIDELISAFGFSPDEKLNLTDRWHQGFGKEFGLNKSLKVQIDQKFRKYKKEIDLVLNKSELEDFRAEFYRIIDLKSKEILPLIQEYRNLKEKDDTIPDISSLASSFSHMMINRTFRTKQRLHEMVLYGLLYRHYHSYAMKLKYKEKNKKKSKELIS